MLEKNGITLTISSHATDHFAATGFDPQYGARPIKRVLQRELLNQLSRMILEGNLDREVPIKVDYTDGHLVFSN